MASQQLRSHAKARFLYTLNAPDKGIPMLRRQVYDEIRRTNHSCRTRDGYFPEPGTATKGMNEKGTEVW
ncbi:hypothetical protein Y032_0089g2256 [Ancylostoma ceylanicum]|uniref:Uncharacterized protein n=1 Tax=Ancylostoma ceylanicum TaxID=53326 RepID=A0A016TN84_9BILA|nr:hypothetical protein Y032_0089g2256 [Ancylostoma ceylanicum]